MQVKIRWHSGIPVFWLNNPPWADVVLFAVRLSGLLYTIWLTNRIQTSVTNKKKWPIFIDYFKDTRLQLFALHLFKLTALFFPQIRRELQWVWTVLFFASQCFSPHLVRSFLLSFVVTDNDFNKTSKPFFCSVLFCVLYIYNSFIDRWMCLCIFIIERNFGSFDCKVVGPVLVFPFYFAPSCGHTLNWN